MPPNTSPSGSTWRSRLDQLRQRLDELDAAMRAGQWERLDPLAPAANRAMSDLLEHPGQPVAADAPALRQTLDLANALQTRATERRQQILPLLQAWHSKVAPEKPAP
ncbi:MAG: hypothetical protein LBE62_16295 [Azonexus sp.]|nr:hypothetical protein [Azonexus sp.]